MTSMTPAQTARTRCTAHVLAKAATREDEMQADWLADWTAKAIRAARFGYHTPAMPPLDTLAMRRVIDDASAGYWSAILTRDEADRQCRAALAANAEWRASNRKPGLSAELRTELRNRDGNDCWLCSDELGDDATIEHRTALASGGTWALHNLALCHRDCNQTMGRAPEAVKAAWRASLSPERRAFLERGW